MKFPKLKHSVLCQLLLYLPGFTLFYYVIALWLFCGEDNSASALWLIGLFASIGFSLWYLFANFAALFFADALFSSIRSWKRDRLEYRTSRNGRSRAAVEKHILRRCRRWGRRYALDHADAVQFQLFYRHGISWTVCYSMLEKRVAICSVEHLTAESYRVITSKAHYLLRQSPDGTPHFKTKAEKKAPRAYVFVVVILADRVDGEVRQKARKAVAADQTKYVFPCVVECPRGAYYLDGSREYYEIGMMPRPVKNYASSLMQQLVFGGFLPREDQSTRLPYELAYPLELSLWEYLRIFRKEMRGDAIGEEKERKKMFRRLRDGEVRVGEYAVYCKVGERLAECAYLPDEKDEKLLSLFPVDCWYSQSQNHPQSIRRRKMKQTDSISVQRRIEAQLVAAGYRIQADP